VKAKRVKGLDPREPLIENAARIITARMNELRSFAPAAVEFSNSTDQHDMRIAAKRLRYVLEATEFGFGKAAVRARRRARDLQEVLGEIHDCDVMLPRVEEHIGRLRSEDAAAVGELAAGADDLDPAHSARAPNRTAYRGLEVLAIHVEARRKLLFDRFLSLWGEIEDEKTWKKLERALDANLAEARARRAAAQRAARAARALERAEREREQASERARQAAAELAEAERARGNGADPLKSRSGP
jgi:hypothetical protein